MSTEKKNHRQLTIAKCQQCNGAPPTKSFELQHIKGEECTICMEVVSWKREGKPIRTKESIANAIQKEEKEKKNILSTKNVSDYGVVEWNDLNIK